MKFRRIDHVGVNVNDFEAAKAFFLSLGMELQYQWDSEGEWLDQIVGLAKVKTTAAFLTFPEGGAKIELVKYHHPVDDQGVQTHPSNRFGIQHIAILVDDLDALVANIATDDLRPFSRVQTFGDVYKQCYFRGPEGIVLELAEELRK